MLDVLPPRGRGRRATRAARRAGAAAGAEQLLEHVREVAAAAEVEVLDRLVRTSRAAGAVRVAPAARAAALLSAERFERVAAPTRRAARADAGVAELVVVAPLALVRQHVVRLLHFLESLLRLLVVLVDVRVELAHELAMRPFDLVGRCALGYAERVVVVSLFGHKSVARDCSMAARVRRMEGRCRRRRRARS